MDQKYADDAAAERLGGVAAAATAVGRERESHRAQVEEDLPEMTVGRNRRWSAHR